MFMFSLFGRAPSDSKGPYQRTFHLENAHLGIDEGDPELDKLLDDKLPVPPFIDGDEPKIHSTQLIGGRFVHIPVGENITVHFRVDAGVAVRLVWCRVQLINRRCAWGPKSVVLVEPVAVEEMDSRGGVLVTRSRI